MPYDIRVKGKDTYECLIYNLTRSDVGLMTTTIDTSPALL